jgi:hypothetical protein
LYALLYLLVPGFSYSLNLGLPESIGMALLLAAIYAYLKDRITATAALLAASLFFRETGYLVALSMMAFEAFGKRRFGRAVLIGASAGPYFLWRIFLTWRLFEVTGWKTLLFSPGDFTPPFLGLRELLREIAAGRYDASLRAGAIAYAILLTAMFALALILFLRERSIFSLSLLLFSLVSVSLNYKMIWASMENGVRGTYEVFVFLILAVVAATKRPRLSLRMAWTTFFAAVLVFQVFLMTLGAWARTPFLPW